MPLKNEVNLRDITSRLSKIVVHKIGFSDPKDFEDKCTKVHLALIWDVLDIVLDTLYEARPDIAQTVNKYLEEEEKDLVSQNIILQ